MFRIILFSALFIVFKLGANQHRMNLQKALDMKLVAAKALSLGGYQGFCMKIQLKNLGPDSLCIFVEAGRRLNSLEEMNQDILLVQSEIILLRRGEAKWFNVKGYCCQASNRCPSKNAEYAINTMADSNLVKVAKYINATTPDNGVIQQAIWAISDNKPIAGVANHNDPNLLPLRQLLCSLKGEVLPWYTIVSNNHLYPNGVISVTPLFLKGEMTYSNDKDNYVTCYVLNEKGVPVCQVKSQWLKACNNATYTLDLPVKGLASGKYSIALKTNEKQLAVREFVI